MPVPKKTPAEWRARAAQLVARAAGEKKAGNLEAARTAALQAVLVIAEHKLLEPPPAVARESFGEVIRRAKEAGETVRAVAGDSNVQGMAAAAMSIVGNLAELAAKRKKT